jgi:hypothetical protein
MLRPLARHSPPGIEREDTQKLGNDFAPRGGGALAQTEEPSQLGHRHVWLRGLIEQEIDSRHDMHDTASPAFGAAVRKRGRTPSRQGCSKVSANPGVLRAQVIVAERVREFDHGAVLRSDGGRHPQM